MTTNTTTLIYVSRDGDRFTGSTATEVVDAMRRSSAFTENETSASYMQDAAARHARYENVIVRCDTAENFLHDLTAAGVLKQEVAS